MLGVYWARLPLHGYVRSLQHAVRVSVNRPLAVHLLARHHGAPTIFVSAERSDRNCAQHNADNAVEF